MTTNRLVFLVSNIYAIGAVFVLAGCQHALTIKNLNEYQRTDVVAAQPVAVGLVVQAADVPRACM